MRFLENVPVATDPCGRLQYGIPNNNTEHQTLAKADYTMSSSQSLFARYLYAVYDNPATYDGTNVLTLSRTGQNNQAHSIVVGPQLDALRRHHQRAARHLQQDAQRSAAAASSSRPRTSASTVYGPQPGFMGVTVTNGFSFGVGAHQPRVLQLRQLPDRERHRHRPREASDVVRRQLDPDARSRR